MMTRQQMLESAWICVLDDGETYTGLDGCWIAMTTDQEAKDLDDGGSADDLQDRFSLQALLEFAVSQGYFDKEKP
jgi:hypothetical protein